MATAREPGGAGGDTEMEGIAHRLMAMETRAVTLQLQDRFRRNLRLLEEAAPRLHRRFAQHHTEKLGLHYTDERYVQLVDRAAGGRAVYPGDPARYTLAQLDRFSLAPKSFRARNLKATVLDEESNAHVLNSNRTTDLLEEQPQERFETLPDYVHFMVVLGVGLGYHLKTLLAAADIRHMCVIEPQADIFHASLHTIDWLPVLRHFSQPGYSLDLIVGEDADGCARQLDDYLSDIGGFHAVHPFVYEHLASPELSEAVRRFTTQVIPRHMGARGYFDDEQVGFAHSVTNHRERIPVLQGLAGPSDESRTAPAFVVANGPSLDRAVDFLREHQDRAIIFSCGTALGSLTKAGIKPDFHVEMERSRPVVEWIESATEAEDRKGVTLLALNTVHPEVFGLFERRALAMKSNDVGADYVCRFLKSESTVVALGDCNPTVANCAMAFVSALGFQDVYWFGLDLGFPAGPQHHSSLSTHYEVKKEAEHTLGLYRRDSEHNVTAPGNFGGEIVSTPVYMGAKAALERVLASSPGMRCRNTSAGLLIEGAEPTCLGDIALPGEELDKAAEADDIFGSFFSTRGLIPPRDEDVEAVAAGTARAIETLRGLVGAPVTSRRAGMDVLTRMHALVAEMAEDDELRLPAAFLKGSVDIFCVLLAQALHRLVDEEPSVDLYRRCLVPFGAFLDGAQALAEGDLTAEDTRTRDLVAKLAG